MNLNVTLNPNRHPELGSGSIALLRQKQAQTTPKPRMDSEPSSA